MDLRPKIFSVKVLGLSRRTMRINSKTRHLGSKVRLCIWWGQKGVIYDYTINIVYLICTILILYRKNAMVNQNVDIHDDTIEAFKITITTFKLIGNQNILVNHEIDTKEI